MPPSRRGASFSAWRTLDRVRGQRRARSLPRSSRAGSRTSSTRTTPRRRRAGGRTRPDAGSASSPRARAHTSHGPGLLPRGTALQLRGTSKRPSGPGTPGDRRRGSSRGEQRGHDLHTAPRARKRGLSHALAFRALVLASLREDCGSYRCEATSGPRTAEGCEGRRFHVSCTGASRPARVRTYVRASRMTTHRGRARPGRGRRPPSPARQRLNMSRISCSDAPCARGAGVDARRSHQRQGHRNVSISCRRRSAVQPGPRRRCARAANAAEDVLALISVCLPAPSGRPRDRRRPVAGADPPARAHPVRRLVRHSRIATRYALFDTVGIVGVPVPGREHPISGLAGDHEDDGRLSSSIPWRIGPELDLLASWDVTALGAAALVFVLVDPVAALAILA